MLRASSVSRSFSGVRALDEVTLEVHRHEVVGLIGPNGAGKSTLVNVLSGFDTPSTGTVELAGDDVTTWRASRRARAGLSRTFQHSRSFRSLSVRENVEVAALRHDRDVAAPVVRTVEQPGGEGAGGAAAQRGRDPAAVEPVRAR